MNTVDTNKLVDAIKATVAIIDRAGMATYTNYDQDMKVRAFDRVLQRILKQEFGA